MTLRELIRDEVSVRQVAELYGLKFDRSGRGFCPWHDDGKHAALKFFKDDKGCYCHACHNHGDAVELAAQILGISEAEAEKRIKQDFHLDKPIDNRPRPETEVKAKKRRDKQAEFNRRWCELCDVVHEADARLAQYTPETIDAEFDVILGARCKADMELDLMWEDLKRGRSR